MSAVTAENTAPGLTSGPGIPMSRLVSVELRKLFNTRSGFWLVVSIGIVAAIATLSVVAFVPDEGLNYLTFMSAIGYPLGILLPIVAVLSVTSEWSQRTGLVTFTMEPRRSRSMVAKALAAIVVGIPASIAVLAIGALGNVVGTALNGIEPTWNIGSFDMAAITLGFVIQMLNGFAFAVLIRNSAGAVVVWVLYAAVLPFITNPLAFYQDWFRDIQPWIDFTAAQGPLFSAAAISGEEWAQMATSGSIWLLLPLVVGVSTLLRAEVK